MKLNMEVTCNNTLQLRAFSKLLTEYADEVERLELQAIEERKKAMQNGEAVAGLGQATAADIKRSGVYL